MREFLATLKNRVPTSLVPPHRYLFHFRPSLQQTALALDLILQGLLHRSERIEILDLDFRALRFATHRSEGNIGLAAHSSLLHVPGTYPQVAQKDAQLAKVLPRLLWRTQVRATDDFHQRHPGTVEINQAVTAFVCQLGRILLQMHSFDSDLPNLPIGLDL